MGVSNNRGYSKMDGENHGNPFKMDDLGGKPTIFGNTQISGVRPCWDSSMAPPWAF